MSAPLFVRDAGGVPLPPSHIVAALQAWEPALGLTYHAVQWAFTWTWKENDPRRARVRSGELPEHEARDIIGYIPIDCSLEDVPSYAVQCLRQYPRDEVRKLVDSVHRYNAVDVGRAQTDAIINDVLGGARFGQSVSKTPGTIAVPSNVARKGPAERILTVKR